MVNFLTTIGIIGAGGIVPHHIKALRAAGFNVEGICSKPLSENSRKLAKLFSIPYVYDSLEEIAKSPVDAFLIAVPKENTIQVLEQMLLSKKPILVEKPVFVGNQKFLGDFDSKNVMVAYNRRYYRTVAALKERIQKSSSGSIYCHIPELSSTSKPTPAEIANEIMGNTVHYFDTIHFLLSSTNPGFELTMIEESSTSNSCFLTSTSGSIKALLHLTFGSPGNYRIEFQNGEFSSLLSPIESFTEYNAMKVLEPSVDYPLRRYVPDRGVDACEDFFEDLTFKPGFLEQSKEFLALVKGGSIQVGATLESAFEVSKLAHSVAKEFLTLN